MLHLITPILQLDYPAWRLSFEEYALHQTEFLKQCYDERCIYCGKDSWTCEHFNAPEQGSGEYETDAERNQ